MFNYIKEDIQANGQTIARKYFSGGEVFKGVFRDLAETSNPLDPDVRTLGRRGEWVSVESLSKIADSAMSIQSIMMGSLSPANTPNVLEVRDADFLDPEIKETAQDLPIDEKMRDEIIAFSTSSNMQDFKEYQITLKKRQRVLKSRKESGKGFNELDQIELETIEYNLNHSNNINQKISKMLAGNGNGSIFKVTTKPLKYGFAIDKDKNIIYVSPEQVEKIKKSPNREFNFYARKLVNLLYSPFNASFVADRMRIVLAGESPQKIAEATAVAIGREYVLHKARALENEYKYARSAFPSGLRSKFHGILSPEQLITNLENNIMFSTNKKVEAYYQSLAEQISGISGVEPVPPSDKDIAVNDEALNLGKALAYIMGMNVMDGIVNYQYKPKVIDGKITLPEGVDSFLLSASKFGPATFAQDIILILMPWILSGVSLPIVDVSAYDPLRKEGVEVTAPERYHGMSQELDELFGKAVYLLPEDEPVLQDLPLENQIPLKKSNGEEVSIRLLFEWAKKLLHFLYAAGGDHKYIWRPTDPKRDSKPIVSFKSLNSKTLNYLMIYPEMSFELFKDLIIRQVGLEGARKFVDFSFDNKKEYTLDMNYRQKVIKAIRDADNYKKMRANLKAIRDEMQRKENKRAAELNEEPRQVPLIFPELDVPGKLLLIQDFIRRHINPEFSIIFAYMYREGEYLGDPLCDQLLHEGRLASMNIPGFSGNVAATYTRQALEMLYYVFAYPVNLSLFSGVTRSTFNVLEDNKRTIKLTRFQQLLLPLSGGLLLRKSKEELEKEVITPFQKIIKGIVDKYAPGLEVAFEVLPPDLKDNKIDPNRLSKSVIRVKSEGAEDFLRLEFRVLNAYGEDQEPLNTVVFSQPVYSEDGHTVFHGVKDHLEADLREAVKELNTEKGKIHVNVSDAAMDSFVNSYNEATMDSVSDWSGKTASNRQARQDKNTLPTGGIDFNARNLQMDISGETIDIKFDPATIERFQSGNFSGVVPIIIQITSVQNPLALFGVNPAKEPEALAKF